ncbi:MAG: 5-formyltetrahydrofolate cyclo-ligase [Syntrophomonadaceae bacterium]|nr:5-formyltetrahydrofolate cyclo-ligase [Syntrophomonadaceae bacterium]
MDRRQRLREEIQILRSALSPQEVESRSELVTSSLKGLSVLHNAQNIMCYVAIGREVNINSFWQEQIGLGKRILLPRVKGDQLEAVLFPEWDTMGKGPFGIREPLGEAFPPEMIDAVLVPGLVFDHWGNRLGYGKGFYDRFLTQLRDSACLCGVAYHFQLVEDTFPTTRDVPLHMLVTDKEILTCLRSNQ